MTLRNPCKEFITVTIIHIFSIRTSNSRYDIHVALNADELQLFCGSIPVNKKKKIMNIAKGRHENKPKYSARPSSHKYG